MAHSRNSLTWGLFLSLAVLLSFASCAYFNTFYNARKSYSEALELARQYPDDPVRSEEVLLDEAIAGAAKILAVYPESRWIDDAQLLLGDALLQSGRRTLTGSGTSDFSEAMMAYASAVIITEDQSIRDMAHLGMGLSAMELGRYNDAVASFENVSTENDDRFISSRLYLIDALLQNGEPWLALDIADSLGIPGDDSLAAELTLSSGRALMAVGLPDSGAARVLEAGEMFGRGNGYYRSLTTAADAYIQAGKPQLAVEVLNRLLSGYRSDIETAAIALLDGKARELAEDTSGAMASYRSAADLDRYREYGAEALYRRALLLERADRIDDALENLEELAGRSGDYIWLRLGDNRYNDLILLHAYLEELGESRDDERWLYRVMIAEKRIDLYGRNDELAHRELTEVSESAPDMERSMSMAILADLLQEQYADSSLWLLNRAYALSDSGDLATAIEDRLNYQRGPGYGSRPSVVLQRAWDLIVEERYFEAWDELDRLAGSRWSRTRRPELLWALFTAAEGARMDDDILEGYLVELSDEYAETQLGIMALNRLGGAEEGGSEE